MRIQFKGSINFNKVEIPKLILENKPIDKIDLSVFEQDTDNIIIRSQIENFKEALRARMNGKMRDHYRIVDEPLGKGAYGEVRKCHTIPFKNYKGKSSCKRYRAVKILSKAYMGDTDKLGFVNEI